MSLRYLKVISKISLGHPLSILPIGNPRQHKENNLKIKQKKRARGKTGY